MSEIKAREFKVHPVEELQAELDKTLSKIAEELCTGAHIVAKYVISIQLRESFPADSRVQGANVVETWVIFYCIRG